MTEVTRARFLRDLTTAFLSGEWTAAGLFDSAKRVIKRRARWLSELAARVVAAFPQRPSFSRLYVFLVLDAKLARICHRIDWRKYPESLQAKRRSVIRPPTMDEPPSAMGAIAIPGLPTEAALAECLGVSAGKLRWYADITGRNRKHPPGPLRTYRHRWVPKRGGRARVLEIPTGGLKRLQRKILDDILNHIPPHPAAHGFRPGHSVVTNATPHCGKRIVLRFDLTDFFPS
ncbi:MAG TPA: hypothetical protein VKE74_04725, partial [Gemmataceae bacterium]|nr:hypothetical protein [Gemmataceae bacterium]